MLILACSQLDEMKPGGDYLTMEGPQQSPVRYFAKVMLLSSNNAGMVEGYAFMTAHITSREIGRREEWGDLSPIYMGGIYRG